MRQPNSPNNKCFIFKQVDTFEVSCSVFPRHRINGTRLSSPFFSGLPKNPSVAAAVNSSRSVRYPGRYSFCGSAGLYGPPPEHVRSLPAAVAEPARVPEGMAVSAFATQAAASHSVLGVFLILVAADPSLRAPAANCSRARCTNRAPVRDRGPDSIVRLDRHLHACCVPCLCLFPARRQSCNCPQPSKCPASQQPPIFRLASLPPCSALLFHAKLHLFQTQVSRPPFVSC